MKIHCVDEKLLPRYLDPWNAVFWKLPVDLGRNSWCFTWHLMGKFWRIQKPRKALAGWGFGVPIEGPVLPLDATSKDHPIFPSRMRAVEHHQFSVRPWSDTNSPQRLKSTPTQTLEMIYPPILWRFSLVQPYQLREFFEKSREIWDSICFLMKRKYLDLLHPEKKKKKRKIRCGFRVRWNVCINKGLSCFTGWKVDPKSIAALHNGPARLAVLGGGSSWHPRPRPPACSSAKGNNFPPGVHMVTFPG